MAKDVNEGSAMVGSAYQYVVSAYQYAGSPYQYVAFGK
jgi:hypothetical protein